MIVHVFVAGTVRACIRDLGLMLFLKIVLILTDALAMVYSSLSIITIPVSSGKERCAMRNDRGPDKTKKINAIKCHFRQFKTLFPVVLSSEEVFMNAVLVNLFFRLY